MEPTQSAQPRRRTKHAHNCCSQCGACDDVKKPRKERKPHPLKGTDEIKERMAALRALKGKFPAAVADDIIAEDLKELTR